MEHRVGFEPTVLRICNPLHWASLPPVHCCWCRQQDSNLHTQAYLACALARYKLASLPLSYGGITWRSQGVTIPFFQRDRLMCVHEHFETKYGGDGEIRTHGPIPRSTVFKTVAINRALPHLRINC